MAKNSSLQDQAYYEIQKRIQRGHYSPGEKLVVQDICDSLKIGRTPVIAAINRLVAQGLLEAAPNRGVTVAPITPRRLMEFADARLMIETFCAKLIIKNAGFFPDVVEEMRGIVGQLKTVQDLDTAFDLENRFHTLYVKLSGNQMILSLYESVWSAGTLFYVWQAMGTRIESIHHTLEESEQILNLCLGKDADALEAYVRHHLQHVYNFIDQYLRLGIPA